MKKRPMMFLLCGVFAMSGVWTGTIRVSADVGQTEYASVSDIWMTLFSRVVQTEQSDSENILISPLSIMNAMMLLENGAEGDTRSEMELVLNGGMSVNDLNVLLRQINERAESVTDVKWNIANSIWANACPLADSYQAEVGAFFDAELIDDAFDSDTADRINRWVEENTDGMISGIVDEIPQEALLYLVNAVAFDAEWEMEYWDTSILEDSEFTNSDGSIAPADYLCSTEETCFELAGGTAFIKPYMGGEYTFVGIEIPEDMTTAAYLEKLSEEEYSFSAAYQNARYAEVYVRLPEFSMEFETSLKGSLSAMGLSFLFEGGDLSGMFADNKDVAVGDVIHKTYIDVNRRGTRAAAVTSVEVDATAIAPEYMEEIVYVTLDRPFVYAIVDDAVGLPLFIGSINTITD